MSCLKNKYRLLVLILLFTGQWGIAQNADINLLKKINGNGTAFKDNYFEIQSGSLYPVTAAVPLGQFTTGLIKKDKRLKKEALWSVGTFVANIAVTRIIKYSFNRKRPFETWSFIVKRNNVPNGKSFPSGHASSSFCTATWLALSYKKWYVAVPAYLWAGGVSYARMYLGVHYPSDVLTGALIGSGIAWAGYEVKKKLERKKQQKKAVVLL
jgi:membrane-associated phospholipid phosphatase